MRVSGFTFARNVLRLNYPIREVIESLLPLVDEVVVGVGVPDEDGTLDLVRSLGDPRIRIIESTWNPNLKTGGYVLAQQTNVALFNCTGEWAIYLQADEVLHEEDHEPLRAAMARFCGDDAVEGLSLRRLHFYGDFHTRLRAMEDDMVCRIVKPHKFVLSRGDALGFTVLPKYKERGRRIRVVETTATVYHYGWVTTRDASQRARAVIDALWSERAAGRSTYSAPAEVAKGVAPGHIYSHMPRQFVMPFEGTHPVVMRQTIASDHFRLDLSSDRWRKRMTFAQRLRLAKARLRALLPGVLRRYLSRNDCVFLDR